jgi:hypothetical protein
MSAPSNQCVALIPAQPTVLLEGDRRISVEDWPLARSVEERRTHEVVRSDEMLVIAPKRGSAAGKVVMVMLFGLSALPVLVVPLFDLPVWMAAIVSIVFFLMLLLLVRGDLASRKWMTFDRRANRFSLEKRVGFRNQRLVERTFPLDSIKAVQLLHSGRHSVSETQGAGEQQWISNREFHGYELNLVVDEKDAARVNIASLSDWQWIRETGGQIAEFLGVPVIDKLYHGG